MQTNNRRATVVVIAVSDITYIITWNTFYGRAVQRRIVPGGNRLETARNARRYLRSAQ